MLFEEFFFLPGKYFFGYSSSRLGGQSAGVCALAQDDFILHGSGYGSSRFVRDMYKNEPRLVYHKICAHRSPPVLPLSLQERRRQGISRIQRNNEPEAST